MAVTHFVTQFTHVSRHPRVKNRKQKKIWKTVLKMWSQICGKKFFVSTKKSFRKKFKNKKLKIIKTFIIFVGL